MLIFLFQSITYLCLKYLLNQPVIHFLGVCFRNVAYKFLDHPFESKTENQFCKKQPLSSLFLLCKSYIDKLS